MVSTRTIAIVAAVAMAAVGILAVYLFLELGDSNEQLAATRTTLADTQTTLADTTTTLQETTDTLQETDSALSEQVATNTALESTMAAAQRDNAILARRNDTLARDLLGAETEVVLLDSNLNQANQQLSTLQQEHDTLQEGHALLRGEHSALQQTHDGLQAQHQTLQEQAGTVEGLRTQAETLRLEISELEAMREPLVLDSNDLRTRGFKCTGSMEPVITCLDEVRWLADFDAVDIVVGSTISFDLDCDTGQVTSYWTAHRVMEIEVRDGVHHYWPKGDNNRKADGCWIPEQHVRGYVVEIYKGVVPENEELRDNVNRAKNSHRSMLASLDVAQGHVDDTSQVLDAARAIYNRLWAANCGDVPPESTCFLDEPAYSEVNLAHANYQTAYRSYRAAYNSYELTFAAYERVRDHYACWLRNAKESESPGHIPHAC